MSHKDQDVVGTIVVGPSANTMTQQQQHVDKEARMARLAVRANRSPLRGIREQENEDASEITYRPSNIYVAENSQEERVHD